MIFFSSLDSVLGWEVHVFDCENLTDVEQNIFRYFCIDNFFQIILTETSSAYIFHFIIFLLFSQIVFPKS